uniref:Uncharacterized protein n=1 Tax=Mesocestoides corti TaxID=53468 RepID=A0A5K3EMP6_MESCO
MNRDEGEFTGGCWDRIPETCIRFHLPFQHLCRKCYSINKKIRRETELYNQSAEVHLHRTLRATLNIYQDPSQCHTWENFKRAADLLADMHRRAKVRLEGVFASSYLSGDISFSKKFLYQFGSILQNSEFRSGDRALPEGLLHPLLCSSSDPPRGAFVCKRRILRVPRRRRQTLTCPLSASTTASIPTSVLCSQEDGETNEKRTHVTKCEVKSPTQPSCLTETASHSDEFCCCSSCSSSSSSRASSCSSSPSSDADHD